MSGVLDHSDSLSDAGTAVDNNQRRTVAMEKGNYEDSKVPFLTLRTFFMTMLVSMGGICFGYDTGQISGFQEMDNFLYQFADQRNGPPDSPYSFTWQRSGLIVGMLSIGTLIGALTSASIANSRVGRKMSVLLWCAVFIIGNIVQMAAEYPEWYTMMAGRIVSGLGIGGLSVLVPMYQGEAAPTHIRGAIVCCYQLFITIGILLSNIFNYATEGIENTGSWRIPLGIGFLWPLILGGGMLLFPESPRHDYANGKVNRAQHSIAKFYGVSENHQVIHSQMRELQEKLESERAAGKGPWYEVFTGPRMLYRILLGMAIQMFQQLTGMNYFMYFGTTLFGSVGIGNSFITQIILGAVNVVCTFPGLYMVEKFGRRKCLTYGALWQFACWMVFASLGQFRLYTGGVDEAGERLTDQTIGYVMIIFACLFIASFASTWGPMAWAVVAEMYPTRYRSTAISFCASSNWIWNFYLAFTTRLISEQIDFAYGYVFAGCNLAAAATVYFFLLESNNKSLEEIDTMYLLHVPPLQSSKWEAPVGEDLVTADQVMLHGKKANGVGGTAAHREDTVANNGVVGGRL
ncbi:MFS general substrate transporter [Glarea lozoyensis ATCC 20868]|uniref:MFS general substrate transporter n=1 Tax=Glarea lozoyensis (strain ATCC 20868 / MF5171) TaxID=1116229 RepID=S3DRS0_GLAL2|nr:MFS general substrate transporter [Glarea lozoyensis ATCC 20868]EPE29153.1 MFS general substrate transporter [Glarea lozoyensis ATCC 20868]